MTKARDLAELIGNSLIDGDEIATGAVGTSNLAATLDFSSKTMVMANDQLSGDKIDGGTISNFASTGIDDNSSSTSVTILSNGEVGIGTSPASWAKLDILGSGGLQTGATQALQVKAPSATAGEGVGIRLNAASGSHEAVGIIGMVNNPSGNAGAMTFHTYNLGATIPEVMRIDNLGKVGIGTPTPGYKLDVNGTIRSQGAITTTLTSSGGTFLSIGHSGNENWSFDAKSGSGSTDYVDFGIAGGTRCMTWQEDGNVGIGTDAPASPLHVQADDVAIRLDGTGNTSRKIFFRNTTNANKAEIYADGGLKIWTDDAGTDLLLAPAGSLLMATMPQVTIDSATEYSTTETSELAPVATDALFLYNEENTSTNGKISILMRSAGGGGGASARITLKNERSGSGGLGFFFRDNGHTGDQREKMYLSSDGNLTVSGGYYGDVVDYYNGSSHHIASMKNETGVTTGSTWTTVKQWTASHSGQFTTTFAAYIQTGGSYYNYRFYNATKGAVVKMSNNSTDASHFYNANRTSYLGNVHQYSFYSLALGKVSKGDVIHLQMVSASGGGVNQTGSGQTSYVKQWVITTGKVTSAERNNGVTIQPEVRGVALQYQQPNASGPVTHTIPIFLGSGTHNIFSILGGFDQGTMAVASVRYVGLYGYAGAGSALGDQMATIRRANSNTAWQTGSHTVHYETNGGSVSTPSFAWTTGGVLQMILAGSVQIVGEIKITAHSVPGYKYGVTT